MVDNELARTFARQHGLITRDQALAGGATGAAIRHRLEAGRWVRVGPRLYRLAGVPVTWHQRALAACMVAGPAAVVSHRAAAVAFGVSGFRPGRLEITVPPGRGNRNPLATVHRSTVPPGDRSVREGVPVTRPGRLLVDLARVVPADVLEEAVDDVLCRRLVSLEQLLGRLDGRRVPAALQEVLAAWTPGALPGSVAEMTLVRALLASGLPPPVRQHPIPEARARVDLAYPDARVAIELDSFRWHAGRRPFRSDRSRGNRIVAAGWRLLRAAPRDLQPVVSAAARLVRRVA